MDTDTFDRLSRTIGMSLPRRAAVAALLGSGLLGCMVLGSELGTVAKGKGKRKSKRRRPVPTLLENATLVQAESKPLVIGPEEESGTEDFFDCGAFMIRDQFKLIFTLRLLFDKDGNLVKGVETVSGTDTFINAATGKSITAPFHNHVQIDFTADPPLGANSGVIYKVTVPGAGAVFLDVGRIVTDRTGTIIAFKAGPHQAFDGDFAGLCAVLA
jgi:hypothetical protein